MLKMLNSGDRSVSDQFNRWIKDSTGKPLAGLIKRRQAEKLLFNTPLV
jgi:GH24 family phage-related lysozyme (muramidase)